MLVTIKQLLKHLVILQNNPAALVTVVALASSGVAVFALYVVLKLAGHQ